MISFLGIQNIFPAEEQIHTLGGTHPWKLTYSPNGGCQAERITPPSEGLHVVPNPDRVVPDLKYFSV